MSIILGISIILCGIVVTMTLLYAKDTFNIGARFGHNVGSCPSRCDGVERTVAASDEKARSDICYSDMSLSSWGGFKRFSPRYVERVDTCAQYQIKSNVFSLKLVNSSTYLIYIIYKLQKAITDSLLAI